jgi:hypothetical protein
VELKKKDEFHHLGLEQTTESDQDNFGWTCKIWRNVSTVNNGNIVEKDHTGLESTEKLTTCRSREREGSVRFRLLNISSLSN